jgi:hypothetical protein
MGRTACTEPQCLYSRSIPLLPLWAVRPVQSLSACTMVHFTFTLRLSETSVSFYQNVLRHLAEAGTLHSHCRVKVCCDSVKSFPFNSVYWAFSWAFKMEVGPSHLNQIKLCTEESGFTSTCRTGFEPVITLIEQLRSAKVVVSAVTIDCEVKPDISVVTLNCSIAPSLNTD